MRSDSSSQHEDLTPMPRGWRLAGILTLLAAAGVALGWWQAQSMRRLRDAPAATIAIARLRASPADAFEAAVAHQLTRELAAALRAIRGIRVLDETLDPASGNEGDALEAVAASRGASVLLQGSVRRTQADFRIDLRLSRPADGRVLWSASIACPEGGSAEVADRVAYAVARALRVR